MENYKFTHIWVKGHGWYETQSLPGSFNKVEIITISTHNEVIFVATQGENRVFIFKGIVL